MAIVALSPSKVVIGIVVVLLEASLWVVEHTGSTMWEIPFSMEDFFVATYECNDVTVIIFCHHSITLMVVLWALILVAGVVINVDGIEDFWFSLSTCIHSLRLSALVGI